LADIQRTVYPHSGQPSAAGRAQDRVSSPAKDRRSANCATQPTRWPGATDFTQHWSLMMCWSQEMQTAFNSNIKSRFDVQVAVSDFYAQKAFDVYRGFLQLFTIKRRPPRRQLSPVILDITIPSLLQPEVIRLHCLTCILTQSRLFLLYLRQQWPAKIVRPSVVRPLTISRDAISLHLVDRVQ